MVSADAGMHNLTERIARQSRRGWKISRLGELDATTPSADPMSILGKGYSLAATSEGDEATHYVNGVAYFFHGMDWQAESRIVPL